MRERVLNSRLQEPRGDALSPKPIKRGQVVNVQLVEYHNADYEGAHVAFFVEDHETCAVLIFQIVNKRAFRPRRIGKSPLKGA
jgi:hypothetical protein